jgi:phosphoglycerate dehydrogenase-like enzyme
LKKERDEQSYGIRTVGLIGADHIGADYLRAARFFEQMKVAVFAEPQKRTYTE